MKKLRRKIFFLLCSFMFMPLLYADGTTNTTPEPYKDDEFPQFMKDARRAEIITLGAMPFVTLNTTLGYSFVRYSQHDFLSDYIPNPFAKTSDSNGFTENEQKTILLTSIGISMGIGLTDFIVNIIRRNNFAKQKNLKENSGPILIKPVEQDKDAVKIQISSQHLPDEKKIPDRRIDSDENSTLENDITGEH